MATSPTLLSTLQLEIRVLGTLLLRETRATFGRTAFGYLWAILVPALSTSLLVYLFTLAGRQAPFGHSLALFFVTGIFIIEMVRKLSSGLMRAIDANKALLAYPILAPLDVLVARALLIGLTYTIILTGFLLALIGTGRADFPHDPETVIVAWTATLWFGVGFGVLNSALFTLFESWRHIEAILTRPLLFVSAIFYLPTSLPDTAQAVLWWNPVLHLVEWMRIGIYPYYPTEMCAPWYPIVVGGLMLFAGLAIEHLVRHHRTPS